MMPLAVFAIIPADCARILWAGVTEVQVIVEGAFAAVVAPVLSLNGRSREQLAPRLLAHQRIIEAVMATSPVLPVQFATVVPDRQTVAHVLEEGAPLFRQGFIDFASRVEMELRVLWAIEDILREIAGTERVVARKAEIAAREAAGAVGPEERVTLGRLVAWELEQWRSRLRRRVLEMVLPLATDVVMGSTSVDTVVEVSLLMNRMDHNTFDHCLEILDKEMGRHLLFRLVGPLPPYSFATVQVRCLAAEEVEQARRVLDLDDQATAADLKTAYHQHMKDCHPDVAPAASGVSSLAAALTGAYRLLHPMFAGGAVQGTGRRVLVSLARRESVPHSNDLAA